MNTLIYQSAFSHVTQKSQVGNNPKSVKWVIIYVFSSFFIQLLIQLLCTC